MPVINDYRFGHIVIDGREHTKDVILLPDRVVSNWWRQDGHSLVLEDLADVLEDLPPSLIVGSGAYGRMRPNPGAIEELEERGIKTEILPTEDAVNHYRELDPATTAAALHLTC
jgi:hypothetical protein